MNRRERRAQAKTIQAKTTPAPANPGPTIQAMFAEAVRRQQLMQLNDAERLCRQILAQEPRHSDSLYLLGLIAERAGRLAEAAELVGQALALKPDYPGGHYNHGVMLQALGRHAEAADAYRRAIALLPSDAEAYTGLANALHSLGRGDEAVAAYHRAIELRPGLVGAHYNLGLALQALGQQEEAVGAYRRALALKPDYVEGHNNLGNAFKALHRPREALAAYARALELDPRYVMARNNLGVILQEMGRYDEAAAAYRQAIEVRPDYAEAHYNLGNTLKAVGRDDEAVYAYDRALELRPDYAEASVNLGNTLLEVGRQAEAGAAAERALAIDPAMARAWFLQASLKTFSPGDPQIDRMEAALASATARGVGAEDRCNLEFALGKAWMDAGDPDRAFAHLASGNRLKRASIAYDGQDEADRFAAFARWFGPEQMDRLEGAGDPSDLPVFIVGMPRSGTTLVEQILASHRDVHGAGELPTLGALLFEALPDRPFKAFPELLSAMSGDALADLGHAYVARVSALAPERKRVIDKLPGNFQFAGLIRLMLPNARIIHCRRDPVDTCLSCYSMKFTQGQDFSYDLAELGRFYRSYDSLMAHWRGLLPADRFTEVAYEDVVDDLEGQARRLVAFCGLDWDEACLNFHRNPRPVATASVNQVRQPLYRTSLARWKPYTHHLGPLLDALGVRQP